MTSDGFITVGLLEAAGVAHGFGTRSSRAPDVLRPVQVHGNSVAKVQRPVASLGEADAVVSSLPGAAVAVVTADCVPILAAGPGGRCVAAIHAGWRGLAAGIVEEAVAALAVLGAPAAQTRASVGPHIGACCYEVDAPVTDALRARFGEGLARFVTASRPDHVRLDLAGLTRFALERAGVAGANISLLEACTHCDAVRFHSYRRDGVRAGRLVHWVAARP